jgi:hypothetical protein
MLQILHTLKRFCPGLTSICFMGILSLPSQATVDITDKLETLGNPTQAQYSSQPYARNVWDMQAHGSRLYLGSGNSSNIGPSPNAGPAHIHFFDTATQTFTDAFTTNEEQIDRFVPLNNTVYIPGHDPKGSDPARIYRLGSDEKWSHLTLEGVHIYDLQEFNRRIWVGRGVFAYQNTALVTAELPNFLNNQPSWGYLPVPSSISQTTMRIYNFFQLGKSLFAAGDAYLGDDKPGFFEYLPTSNRWAQVTSGKRFLPGVPPTIAPARFTIRRDAMLNRTSLYIGATTYNDHQYYPIGLYRASSLNYIRQIPLESGFLPWDVMVQEGMAYVLSARQDNSQQFTIRIQKSTNLLNWQTLLEFKRPSFARSFEKIKDDFYFGMGSEWQEESQTSQFTFIGQPEEAGKIYRIKGSSIRSLPKQHDPKPTLKRSK